MRHRAQQKLQHCGRLGRLGCRTRFVFKRTWRRALAKGAIRQSGWWKLRGTASEAGRRRIFTAEQGDRHVRKGSLTHWSTSLRTSVLHCRVQRLPDVLLLSEVLLAVLCGFHPAAPAPAAAELQRHHCQLALRQLAGQTGHLQAFRTQQSFGGSKLHIKNAPALQIKHRGHTRDQCLSPRTQFPSTTASQQSSSNIAHVPGCPGWRRLRCA